MTIDFFLNWVNFDNLYLLWKLENVLHFQILAYILFSYILSALYLFVSPLPFLTFVLPPFYDKLP